MIYSFSCGRHSARGVMTACNTRLSKMFAATPWYAPSSGNTEASTALRLTRLAYVFSLGGIPFSLVSRRHLSVAQAAPILLQAGGTLNLFGRILGRRKTVQAGEKLFIPLFLGV